ncbi:putative hemicentin-1-like [Penaeus vannamei]|uniref:Putative hemicentin-1-like n=1 Tax=Penaeus vannamei TaxID=6689 RepID=A0A423SSF1_PENVA|nr:putative hemicentin-1-like [Penaeus vannamei]
MIDTRAVHPSLPSSFLSSRSHRLFSIPFFSPLSFLFPPPLFNILLFHLHPIFLPSKFHRLFSILHFHPFPFLLLLLLPFSPLRSSSPLQHPSYVPEATLVVEGGRHSAGGGREVMEGKNVMFICSVRADPPAYNITWLHNGRVVGVGGRRWRRDNSSLVVTPVSREDAGLYTCLASNTEGDGHSNAVLLRVAHTPYCSGNPQRHYVVAKNTTVTLTCQVEAVPQDLTFEWKLAAPPITPLVVGKDSGGGVVTGEGPPKRIPSLINLTPGHPQEPEPWVTPAPRPYEVPLPASWEETSREEANANEALLNHRLDPDSPTRSVVSITPTAPAQIICYARNRVGRTRVPCTYTLTVVEPPEPLKECNITNIEETRLEVKCDTRAHTRSHGGEDGGHVHHSPSLSFVRSPEASAQANLEIIPYVLSKRCLSDDDPNSLRPHYRPSFPIPRHACIYIIPKNSLPHELSCVPPPLLVLGLTQRGLGHFLYPPPPPPLFAGFSFVWLLLLGSRRRLGVRSA